MSKQSRVFGCDYCGTMLEETDQFISVMARLDCPGVMFVSLRFCCTDCADKFAKEHSKDKSVFVTPCMSDIDTVPDPASHDFIAWQPLHAESLQDLRAFAQEHYAKPEEYDSYDYNLEDQYDSWDTNNSEHGDCRRESWDTEDYSDDPDQESCTWGNQHGVDDDEGHTENYDDWDEEEPD